MHIVFDGGPLLGEASIGGYLRQMLMHLGQAGPAHEYRLFFRAFRSDTRRRVRRLLACPPFDRCRAALTVLPDRFLEWCWTSHSRRLPFSEAWLGRPDLFVATIYLTPVLRRVPIVLIAYDLIPFRFPQFYGGEIPALDRRLRRGLERAAAVIAISHCTKRDYVDRFGIDPARIRVIYPGLEPRFAPQGASDEDKRTIDRYGLRSPYVLYVGTLGPHKNVGRLVRAFRRVQPRLERPHQLVLCGKAAWGRSVLDEARDLIDSGQCRVLDFIDGDHLPALYRGATAFAFLSLYEGFGLPPAEAMACGTPALVSDAGSLPEVVGDAALQVDPEDDDGIERGLLRLLTDPGLRQTLKERGLRQASRFDWSASAAAILEVFEEVADGARGG